jgi:hypothetical protein
MIIAMARNVSRYRNRAYMSEICEELGRPRQTIVYWDAQGRLPRRLAFKRDENGWRYWTRAQLAYAREWVTSPEVTAPIRGRHKSLHSITAA